MFTAILTETRRYNVLWTTMVQTTIIIIIINLTCGETINPARLHTHIGVRSILVIKYIATFRPPVYLIAPPTHPHRRRYRYEWCDICNIIYLSVSVSDEIDPNNAINNVSRGVSATTRYRCGYMFYGTPPIEIRTTRSSIGSK